MVKSSIYSGLHDLLPRSIFMPRLPEASWLGQIQPKLDIIDDPLLNTLPAPQREAQQPLYNSPPPKAPPQEPEAILSPPRSQSGIPFHTSTILTLREVARAEDTIRLHVSFFHH